MEHESDGDTNCNWQARYSHEKIGIGTGGFGNKRTSGDSKTYPPDECIAGKSESREM